MFVQKLGSRDNISGANHIPPLSGCASLAYGRGFHRQNTVYPHRTILFIHRLLQGKKKKDAYVCYPYRATLTVLFISRDQHHPSIQLESIFRTLPDSAVMLVRHLWAWNLRTLSIVWAKSTCTHAPQKKLTRTSSHIRLKWLMRSDISPSEANCSMAHP